MTFGRCAAALGRTRSERVTIFWRLTKNLRARAKLATHHPARIYALDTALGRAYLRDNVGDITNLWGLWVNDVYHVRDVSEELDVGGEVLDVGANIGLFAVWAARHLPRATIHCFEPLPSNLPLIERNCPGARINAVGVGARSERVRMHVDLQGSIASRIDTRWDTTDSEFEVISLDSYVRAKGITEVALLKVDVEGMEMDVLDGAHETLAMTRRVAIETHGREQHEGVLNRLRAAGFATEQVVREGATGMIRAMRESRLSTPDAAPPQPEVVAWGDRATRLPAAREPSISTPISNGNTAPRPGSGNPPVGETHPI